MPGALRPCSDQLELCVVPEPVIVLPSAWPRLSEPLLRNNISHFDLAVGTLRSHFHNCLRVPQGPGKTARTGNTTTADMHTSVPPSSSFVPRKTAPSRPLMTTSRRAAGTAQRAFSPHSGRAPRPARGSIGGGGRFRCGSARLECCGRSPATPGGHRGAHGLREALRAQTTRRTTAPRRCSPATASAAPARSEPPYRRPSGRRSWRLPRKRRAPEAARRACVRPRRRGRGVRALPRRCGFRARAPPPAPLLELRWPPPAPGLPRTRWGRSPRLPPPLLLLWNSPKRWKYGPALQVPVLDVAKAVVGAARGHPRRRGE